MVRSDGDDYESTWASLIYLHRKLSQGRYVIVYDYGNIPACRQAVTEFQARKRIDTPIETIDHSGIYWRKH